jgi:hypothetical protein
MEEFGKGLAERIQAQVRRRVEQSLERRFSDLEKLADRAAEHPETIAEKLDDDASGVG